MIKKFKREILSWNLYQKATFSKWKLSIILIFKSLTSTLKTLVSKTLLFFVSDDFQGGKCHVYNHGDDYPINEFDSLEWTTNRRI